VIAQNGWAGINRKLVRAWMLTKMMPSQRAQASFRLDLSGSMSGQAPLSQSDSRGAIPNPGIISIRKESGRTAAQGQIDRVNRQVAAWLKITLAASRRRALARPAQGRENGAQTGVPIRTCGMVQPARAAQIDLRALLATRSHHPTHDHNTARHRQRRRPYRWWPRQPQPPVDLRRRRTLVSIPAGNS
jgi:hypothetical protein